MRPGELLIPRREWPAGRTFLARSQFAEGSTFGPHTTFSMGTQFGPACGFGEYCTFGHGAQFGEECVVGKRAWVGAYATVAAGCTFGAQGSFSHRLTVGDRCCFGDRSVFGPMTGFGNCCSFGKGVWFAAQTGWKPGCTAQSIVWDFVYHPPPELDVLGAMYPSHTAQDTYIEYLSCLAEEAGWHISDVRKRLEAAKASGECYSAFAEVTAEVAACSERERLSLKVEPPVLQDVFTYFLDHWQHYRPDDVPMTPIARAGRTDAPEPREDGSGREESEGVGNGDRV